MALRHLFILTVSLLVVFLFPAGVLAQGVRVWTASGSIDNNGDGRADKELTHNGVDTDGDGKADQKEITEKNDNNNDGDFDDPGETQTTTEPITGNAKATIGSTDPDTGRTIRIEAEDTDGDGKLDKVTKTGCATQESTGVTQPTAPNFSGHCPQEVPVEMVALSLRSLPPGVLIIEVDVVNRMPGLNEGCGGPPKVVNHEIRVSPINEPPVLLPGSPVTGTSYADTTGDGVADFSFPTLNKQLGTFLPPPVPGGFYDPLNPGGSPVPGHSFQIPSHVLANSCNSPTPEPVDIRFTDLNGDGHIDSTRLMWDPGQTTLVAAVQNFVPIMIPHLGNGAGLSFLLSIDNPSASDTVEGELSILTDEGTPLSLSFVGQGVTNRIPFSIPPRGKIDFETEGTGDLVGGWARVLADGALGVVERFNLRGVGIAGVGVRQPQTGVIIPVRRIGDLSTGVGVANAISEDITLTLTLKGNDGQTIATKQFEDPLPGDGHLAFFFHEEFPGVDTENFEGTLCIIANKGAFSAEGLELDFVGPDTIFTTLPVTPLVR